MRGGDACDVSTSGAAAEKGKTIAHKRVSPHAGTSNQHEPIQASNLHDRYAPARKQAERAVKREENANRGAGYHFSSSLDSLSFRESSSAKLLPY